MPHLAPRSLNGKFWLTFICTQLGQKVIEFAFEHPFEFNGSKITCGVPYFVCDFKRVLATLYNL